MAAAFGLELAAREHHRVGRYDDARNCTFAERLNAPRHGYYPRAGHSTRCAAVVKRLSRSPEVRLEALRLKYKAKRNSLKRLKKERKSLCL